jgi:hypothetical protein
MMMSVDDDNSNIVIDSSLAFLQHIDEGSVPDVWEVPAGSIFMVQVGFGPEYGDSWYLPNIGITTRIFFFLMALQPHFGPWPTSMKLRFTSVY